MVVIPSDRFPAPDRTAYRNRQGRGVAVNAGVGSADRTIPGCKLLVKSAFHDLAGRVERQFVDELHESGHLVSRHPLPAPGQQFIT